MPDNQVNVKNVQQRILSPSVLVRDIPHTPFVPYYYTNNFIQNTLSRLCAFDADSDRWVPLRVDQFGRMQLSVDVESAGAMKIADRESDRITLFDSQTVPNNSAITHAAVDVESTSAKTLLISSDVAVTVYVQFSDDGTNWYDWVDAAGSALTLSVNNESKAWAIDDYTRYIRIVVFNASGTNATVTAKLLCLT